MDISIFRGVRSLAALAGAVLALSLVAVAGPSPASAATCGTAWASASQDSFWNYTWKGWANGMCSTWTYSWHVDLYMERGGDCEAHNKENFGVPGYANYTSTPTYSNFCDPRVFGGYGCTYFRLHHGTTNASPLVDEGVGCSQRAPAIATQLPGLLAPGEAGTPAEEAVAPKLRAKAAAERAAADAALNAG
jgi:hypothetical protein